MDKFTKAGGGGGGGGANGGVAVKRTKMTMVKKTYMEGGYMKTVNEEVEVTDDDEEPLKPAQTNKTRSSPHPDPKKAKTGAENK
ncbi:unnamed protein product, partial [Laminaria digitata]